MFAEFPSVPRVVSVGIYWSIGVYMTVEYCGLP